MYNHLVFARGCGDLLNPIQFLKESPRILEKHRSDGFFFRRRSEKRNTDLTISSSEGDQRRECDGGESRRECDGGESRREREGAFRFRGESRRECDGGEWRREREDSEASREEKAIVLPASEANREENVMEASREENAMVLPDSEASGEESAMVLSDSEASREVPILADLEDYEIGPMVGKGAFSKVYRAKNRITGEIVALKRLRDPNFETKNREIAILKKLKHDHIIALKALHFSDDNKPCLVLEFMASDLLSLANGTIITSENIKDLMQQLLKALEYLQSRNILHRDIKDANILVDSTFRLKLGDFGCSRDLSDQLSDVGEESNSRLLSILEMLTDEVITLSYRPPELILGSSDYGPEVDMWSAGCVFAGLLGNTRGRPIFPACKKKLDQLKQIFELCGTPSETNWPGANGIDVYEVLGRFTPCKRRLREVFRAFDTKALDLLDKMLVLDPRKRISAGDALLDNYFKESSKRKREAMNLSPVTEALDVKSFDQIAQICDNLMLQVASEGISFHDDWPYAIHLLGHLYHDNCDSARSLWEKIPTSVKESKPEVVAAWGIAQKLLKRDYAGVYDAVRGYDWSRETKEMVTAFSDVYTKRMPQRMS